MLQGLLQHNILDNGFASHKIPLQIDGNYGIAAAILEQLIHTRPGEIELLPALPQAWPEGSLKGARAHNGLVIDLAWKDHQLTDWKIDAPTPTPIKVHANGQTYNLITPCSAPYDFLSGQTR
jgi:alpha-L-fucosidase 2